MEVDFKLMNIKHCQAKKIMRTVNGARESHEVIDRLELAFIAKDAKLKDQTIVFYQGDESLGLTDELPLLAMWEKKVNAILE